MKKKPLKPPSKKEVENTQQKRTKNNFENRKKQKNIRRKKSNKFLISMFLSMFHGFYYTFQKTRSIIKEITAAIDARETREHRKLLIFLNGGIKYGKESLS